MRVIIPNYFISNLPNAYGLKVKNRNFLNFLKDTILDPNETPKEQANLIHTK